MVKAADTCALCGLAVGKHAVIAEYEGQPVPFCCTGCARVYQLAQENGMLDAVLPASSPADAPSEDSLFLSGQTVDLSIQGMWCASCATVIERLLRRQEGVLAAEVSFPTECARVRLDPGRLEPQRLVDILARLGCRAQVLTGAAPPTRDRTGERLVLQLIAAMAFGMHVMTLYIEVLYPAYATGRYDPLLVRRVQYLVWFLTTPLLLYGGSSILRGARRAFLARTASMDTLVGMGLIAAYAYSAAAALSGHGHVYFDTVTMVTMMVVLGRTVEHYGGFQARKDIRQLLLLQPERASRQGADAWEDVPSGSLAAGDRILVHAGERVPADAVIVEGSGEVTEAILTGEPLPVSKHPDDWIYAGTLVADGTLVARVVSPPGETRLAQIAQLVEQTLSAKPHIQRLADRAGAWLTYGILGLALGTVAVRLAAGMPAAEALLIGVTILVIACPCSLGLATPLALAVALGRTAGRGILIRNPEVLETAAMVDRVAFDKTGTLTQGRMAVMAIHPLPGGARSAAELLRLAAAAEQHSRHPIARALVSAAPVPLPPAAAFRGLAGQGIAARVGGLEGVSVQVGSARFVGVGDETPLRAPAAAAARAETVVWIGIEGAAAGLVTLRDALNPTVGPALRWLRALGRAPAILSGDGAATVRAVAGELRLEAFESGCSPEEKAARLRAWQQAGARVAMVGDGVNDAPALAQADLSITVAGGAAIAGETSDVLLTRADLTLIPWLLRFSARVRWIIRANLAWAFAYNLVALPLAVTGRISPILAALAMAASSILVVANSLLLRWWQPGGPGSVAARRNKHQLGAVGGKPRFH